MGWKGRCWIGQFGRTVVKHECVNKSPDSDSVGLGYILKFCISIKFPGGDAARFGTTLC